MPIDFLLAPYIRSVVSFPCNTAPRFYDYTSGYPINLEIDYNIKDNELYKVSLENKSDIDKKLCEEIIDVLLLINNQLTMYPIGLNIILFKLGFMSENNYRLTLYRKDNKEEKLTIALTSEMFYYFSTSSSLKICLLQIIEKGIKGLDDDNSLHHYSVIINKIINGLK